MLLELPSQRHILDSMTLAVKTNKSILKQIQQHAKQAHIDGVLRDQTPLYNLLNQLSAYASNIDALSITPITINRFMGRIMELLNFYKSKCSFQLTGNFMKEFIDQNIRIIKNYYQENSSNIASMFNKIIFTIKRWLSQIKNKIVGTNKTSTNSVLYSSIVSPSKTDVNKKTFESRYKLTKEVISHMVLYDGMNVDIQGLKSIFLQSRNSFDDLKDDGLSKNRHTAKTIKQYSEAYGEWKKRVKNRKNRQREQKKDKKSSQTSPIKKEKDAQNRYGVSRTPGLLGPVTSKMKAKASQLSRTFIHLNEIKNQKFRRPYAQVKQVLVTGDQINYYPNKNFSKDSQDVSRKASYFMNRGARTQNGLMKKKSLRQAQRLITQ